ncbi:flagellar assembly protein FliW [Effusibacillus consociatus]|uniref:Flagellar assembly factor FliW n=1 Tax=Effusibacillus consociatus TaxID=1117041 RepID=A0ABV9Q6F8_9BACL
MEFRVVLPNGLPGLESMVECTLSKVDEEGPFYILRENKRDISIVLTDPRGLIEDYHIELPKKELEDIELDVEDDAIVLLVTIIGDTPNDFKVNLMAPVIINHQKGLGKQIVLADVDYPTRYPLFQTT